MLGNYDEMKCRAVMDFCSKVGFNRFAICGILANWYHESVFEPNNAQNAYMNALKMTDAQYTAAVDAGTWVHPRTGKNFCADAIGYGLAQWTSAGRKTGLYEYCKTRNKSIADMECQLNFFYKEITSASYKILYTKLMQASSEKQAAKDFMIYYERPQNQSEQNQNNRANTATEFYIKYFVNATSKASVKSGYLMAASAFIAKLWEIVRSYKTLYVLGTWGWPATPNNKARSQKRDYNATTARKVKINNASRDTFFFDCAGLVKGILWGWNGNPDKVYGGAGYACNGVPDSGNLIGLCKDVSTDFSKITPGELVSMPGHVGVYVGDGMVIECTPKWEDSVQQTWLGNIGYTSGHSRTWEKHGKLPWLDYDTVLTEVVVQKEVYNHELDKNVVVDEIYFAESVTYTVQKGDTLNKIAKKFSTTVDQIVADNKIANPSLIRVGQVLTIKGTAVTTDKTYVVKKGDTLSKIAKMYNTTVAIIALKNGILNPNKISVGQVLKI